MGEPTSKKRGKKPTLLINNNKRLRIKKMLT
jgi:hypothetical protein